MWTLAMKEIDLREKRVCRAYPNGVAVLIVNVDGRLYSLSSNCPHMGCSLGGAILEGTVVQCPCHDWRFDVTTGRFIDAPEIRLETYELKTENGDVFINLEKEGV
jgi:3-phenylpropionate/trans-cinnamate dioxygenase ferredoxin subunit